MTTKTKTQAEQIAALLDNDGTRWTMADGVTLGSLAKADGATVERRGDSTRYEFPDGSAIVAEIGGWDIALPGCWCWEGAGHSEACLARSAGE